MTQFLSSANFPTSSATESQALDSKLNAILESDFHGNFYQTLSSYQRVLADNHQRDKWPEFHEKLQTLFMCGTAKPLDGPMVGIPVSIRDSDYFKDALDTFGEERSTIASIEWMATAWNATFADTGLWMGKTYEPVSRETVAEKCNNNDEILAAYDPETTRVGRNYFREPPIPDPIQSIGLPGLEKLWHLKDRPMDTKTKGFIGQITDVNLQKEKAIPYTKTGGYYLSLMGKSVVSEMQEKVVYQLNYRWDKLGPSFPMTRLVDEVVQIAEGIYLGQLVFATKHYNLGTVDLPFVPGEQHIALGEPYKPNRKTNFLEKLWQKILGKQSTEEVDYGYQNNGYFLMMDPQYAKQIYADEAFPQLRPRPGEIGYVELGYDQLAASQSAALGDEELEWVDGWKLHAALREKFTTLILEPSTKASDTEDVNNILKEGESVLQMLQRIGKEISAQTKYEDHLKHFEKLHKLFRSGVAPVVKDGLFQGHGKKGYNVRADSNTKYDWYGEKEAINGFDYYHGATLNLHWGFSETFKPDIKKSVDDSSVFPSALATLVEEDGLRGPNVMDMVWRSIGKYIFPWGGKSYEKISGRKLSMLLDESDDLAERYPERVKQLKTYLASAPHYNLVKKNRDHYWDAEGKYAKHLKSGAWDKGMSDEDKQFWEQEANNNWVYGNNLQDERILAADAIMRVLDMNYKEPDPTLQALSERGPSPFARQGYVFLGVANQDSILPMNNGEDKTKKVFQFHYRYPMIGGAVPIGFCLDELVEIADGLFLGQLIYSTALDKPFHTSTDPAEFKYQLFGYFLLLDDDWQRHRLAIGLDTVHARAKESLLNKALDLVT